MSFIYFYAGLTKRALCLYWKKMNWYHSAKSRKTDFAEFFVWKMNKKIYLCTKIRTKNQEPRAKSQDSQFWNFKIVTN